MEELAGLEGGSWDWSLEMLAGNPVRVVGVEIVQPWGWGKKLGFPSPGAVL